jgi:hypothetical protein
MIHLRTIQETFVNPRNVEAVSLSHVLVTIRMVSGEEYSIELRTPDAAKNYRDLLVNQIQFMLYPHTFSKPEPKPEPFLPLSDKGTAPTPGDLKNP